MVWVYPCKHVYNCSILCPWIYSWWIGKTETEKELLKSIVSYRKRCKTKRIWYKYASKWCIWWYLMCIWLIINFDYIWYIWFAFGDGTCIVSIFNCIIIHDIAYNCTSTCVYRNIVNIYELNSSRAKKKSGWVLQIYSVFNLNHIHHILIFRLFPIVYPPYIII